METHIYYHKFDKSMKSYDLTLSALKEYLKEIGQKSELNALTIYEGEPHKKPFFKEYPDIFHNVSHSGDYWVCAYGLVENGLDLQRNESKNVDRIAKRFFHPREYQWLQKKDKDQFFRLWAFNESYVKYKGDGLTEGLDYFSVIPEPAHGQSIDEMIPGALEYSQQEIPFVEDGYWLVLTTKEKQKIIIHPLELENER